jgi:hypothetical protein
MAGIGEASAIIGVIQFGIEFGKAVNRYVGDYQDASEDVTNLCNSLVVLCQNVEELKDLIDKSEVTHGFTDSQKLDAQVQFMQTTKLAEKLWKKVGKDRSSTLPQGRVLGAEDLDLSALEKAKWAFSTKAWVEECKSELRYLDVKIEMLKTKYNEPGASADDRAQAARNMEHLKKAKELAKQALRDAKVERQRMKNARGRPKVS